MIICVKNVGALVIAILKSIQHGVDLQAQRAESAIVLHVIVKEENNGRNYHMRGPLHVHGRKTCRTHLPGIYVRMPEA